MGNLRVTPYQNNNSHSDAYGKWYMRAFYNQTLDVTELADHIARDSKVERSKVATITQAVMKQIGELLCNGHPIRVPHLGMLKLGVTSEGADSIQEFNARTAIKDLYIKLVPDTEIKKALRDMKFTKILIDQKEGIGGSTESETTEPENPGGTEGSGGSEGGGTNTGSGNTTGGDDNGDDTNGQLPGDNTNGQLPGGDGDDTNGQLP